MLGFPYTRMRRNRRSAWSRKLVRENSLNVSDFIWPIFIIEGQNVSEPIASMPQVNRISIDIAVKEIQKIHALGVCAVALFPCIDANKRTEHAQEAYNPDNLICRAVKTIKDAVPDIGIICDVALDLYTAHGHDGILTQQGYVDNDATLEILTKQSLVQLHSGCDIIAPSDMMDGRVACIRKEIEAQGFVNAQIMSYTAKYASHLYGPFRHAVNAQGRLKGDKKTYQMDCANANEAIEEARLDFYEGADMVIVKPGMMYLDIIYRIHETFKRPVFAYQVSGEYSMLYYAAQNGCIEMHSSVMESLMACKRAGASGVFTYFAPYIAEILND